jgi:hypothetical protein
VAKSNVSVCRVHYPLPLLHEDNPEPEALKRTIRRLRDELEDVKAQLQKRIDQQRHGFLDDDESVRTDPEHAEIQKLREENSLLTAQVRITDSVLFGFLCEPISGSISPEPSLLNSESNLPFGISKVSTLKLFLGNSLLAWRTSTGCSALAPKSTEGKMVKQLFSAVG